MIFTKLTKDLQASLKENLAQVRFLLKKNPAMAYTRIVEIGNDVGKKHGIRLLVNFPHEGKIEDFENYGRRDLSLIIDQKKTRFPVEREVIKAKALEIFGDIKTEDAYMYEGKEGVRIFAPGGKIDILPHSLHIWTFFDDKVLSFCDWLLDAVYIVKSNG